MRYSLVGTNIDGIRDYDSTKMFINVLKHGRKFGSATTPWDGQPTSPIVNGYPTGDFGCCVMTDQYNIKGVYRFTCRGRCTAIKDVASPVSVSPILYDVNADTSVADITMHNDNGQMYLGFYGSNLSDLKLLRPGYSSDSNIFTIPFLDHLRNFGAIRLMDYFKTNNSDLSKWADRQLPTTPTFSVGGGPYEYAFELAHKLNKPIYIHVPHMADDDFIYNLAALVKSKLHPDVPVYLEYSNEVWNWSFTQATWNLNKAIEEYNNGDKTLGSVLNDQNGYRWSRVAKMTVKLSQAFRVAGVVNARPVLCGQIAWLDGLTVGLKYIAQNFGPPKNYIYGIAGAPYYGLNNGFCSRTDLTVDDFFGPYRITWDEGKTWQEGTNYLMDRALAAAAHPNVIKMIQLAEQYGVTPMCYEGGLNLGQFDTSIEAKVALQSDSRLAGVTKAYLEKWFSVGGKELLYFTNTSKYNRYGYWGLTDSPEKLQMPKFTAAVEVAKLRQSQVGLKKLEMVIDDARYVIYTDDARITAWYTDGSYKKLM